MIYTRLAIGGILFLIALYTPLWFFLMCAGMYAIAITSPYEIVIISAMIDVVYGGGAHGQEYIYTLWTGGFLILAAMVRPYFIFHT